MGRFALFRPRGNQCDASVDGRNINEIFPAIRFHIIEMCSRFIGMQLRAVRQRHQELVHNLPGIESCVLDPYIFYCQHAPFPLQRAIAITKSRLRAWHQCSIPNYVRNPKRGINRLFDLAKSSKGESPAIRQVAGDSRPRAL